MAPRQVPSAQDAQHAVDCLLTALASGGDVLEALDEIRPLHPRNDTFPGEVFIRLAADAMAEANVCRDHPISEEGLLATHLPECEFRGRDQAKIRYALLAATAVHAGIEPDLLGEVVGWRPDDFWSYAGLASVAWIRALADERSVDLAAFCRALRVRMTEQGWH